jgi:DNA-binding transcriptional LysR family regulator
VDIRAIKAFLVVVDRGGFHKAARSLGVAQPTVTSTIRKLEKTVGTPLLYRDRGGTRMTQAGKEFREHALRIIGEIEDAQRAMSAWRGIKGGWLRLGHSPLHRELALAAVAALPPEPSGLRVTVEEAFSAEIEARVRQGDLDFGILHAHGKPEGFVREELTKSTLSLVVHPGHRLAGKTLTDLGPLARERFVLTRGSLRTREKVNKYFETQGGFVPTVAIETNAMTTVLAAVRGSNDLVTLLPMPAPHTVERQGLACVGLPPPLPVETTYVIWTGTGEEPALEPTRVFRQALRALVKSDPTEKL